MQQSIFVCLVYLPRTLTGSFNRINRFNKYDGVRLGWNQHGVIIWFHNGPNSHTVQPYRRFGTLTCLDINGCTGTRSRLIWTQPGRSFLKVSNPNGFGGINLRIHIGKNYYFRWGLSRKNIDEKKGSPWVVGSGGEASRADFRNPSVDDHLKNRPTDFLSAGPAGKRASVSRACDLELAEKPVLGPVRDALNTERAALTAPIEAAQGPAVPGVAEIFEYLNGDEFIEGTGGTTRRCG